MRWAVLIAVLPLVLLAAGQLGALGGSAPTDLGVTDGRLKPPSLSRNSVSSQAGLYADHPQREHARIDPLPLKPSGAQASMQALAQALAGMPGVRVVRTDGNYLQAQARTHWLGFIDDLEFVAQPERGVIDLRSASRLGREDFDVNRKRIEVLRSSYLSRP